jgi:hypothetical protein
MPFRIWISKIPLDQSFSGPGSISPPPLVEEPNFGVVHQPRDVVRGGFSPDRLASCSFFSGLVSGCSERSLDFFSRFPVIDFPFSLSEISSAGDVPNQQFRDVARIMIEHPS